MPIARSRHWCRLGSLETNMSLGAGCLMGGSVPVRGQEAPRETSGVDAGPTRPQLAQQGAPSARAKVLGLIRCQCPTVALGEALSCHQG